MNYTISYAQNREDIILNAFFEEDERAGFYIDVGAEAPTDLSVTKIFYDKGWRGVNIEPIKRQFDLFVEERPRDINLNVGVSNQKGTLRFREYNGSGYSTFSEEMKSEHQSDEETLVKDYKDYDVETRTLQDICDEYQVTSIQFLKVDVEGLEYEVLEGNDWKRYRPEVICIEANHVKNDWRALLKNEQYLFVFFDGLNEYYVDSNTDRVSRFNYVQKVVFKEPIIRSEIANILRQDQTTISELHNAHAKIQEELILARNQITELQSALNDVMPLRRHVLKSVKHRLIGIDQRIVRSLSHDKTFSPASLSRATPQESDIFSTISEYDRRNYDNFTHQRKNSPLLPLYILSRTSTHRIARKLITKARVWK